MNTRILRMCHRSTIGGISVDASVPLPPPLKMLAPRFLTSTQLQLIIGTVDGTPIDPARLAGISVRATGALRTAGTSWSTLPGVIWSSGAKRLPPRS